MPKGEIYLDIMQLKKGSQGWYCPECGSLVELKWTEEQCLWHIPSDWRSGRKTQTMSLG
jgi:hypothetical protein